MKTITKEEKLISMFHSLNETQQEALLLCAEIMKKYADPVPVAEAPAAPDPAPVQTSSAAPVSDVGKRMEAVAHNADIPKNYQMVVGEMEYLFDLAKQERDPYNAFCLAFDYGFVKGSRATKRGLVKAV